MDRAFTLIELLVVVTIIVVLLALLVPAMDKAIYAAEITTCGAKLRALGGGLVNYTTQFQRRYPTRTGLVGGGRRSNSLSVLWHPDGPLGGANGDDRPVLRPYIPINATFNCPMAKAVNLDTADAGANAFTNYGLWYSWRFGQQKGAFKYGDRFEWNGDRFRVLAADFESVFDAAYIQAAHPDKGAVLVNNPQQDAPAGWLDRTYTSSFWDGSAARGVMDRNFMYDDLSVARLDDLIVDDGRLALVPHWDAETAVAKGAGNRDALPAD